MKLSSVILRDKCPALAVNHITVEKCDVEIAFEGGLVTIKRLRYPDEQPFIVPVSNVIEMRPLPSEKKK